MGLLARAQFHDICFGGAPHGGHLELAKLEEVFPMFELRFADVRPPPPCLLHLPPPPPWEVLGCVTMKIKRSFVLMAVVLLCLLVFAACRLHVNLMARVQMLCQMRSTSCSHRTHTYRGCACHVFSWCVHSMAKFMSV